MKRALKNIAAVVMLIASLSACDTQWESHIAAKELKGKTLMQVISEDPDLSVFTSILKKTGYDTMLSGDKTLTVFAPVNTSLADVDMNNTETLKSIVKNHIAYTGYAIQGAAFTADSVVMINQKRSKIDGLNIDGIKVISENDGYNITVRNGVLHKMSGIIPIKQNIWEYLQTQTGHLQVDFIKSQDKLIMDMSKSIQTGVDAITGKPLYDTVWHNMNPVLEAYPLNDETKNFTYVLLPNDVVNRIETKYAKYFAKNNQLKQDSIVRTELIKDCILLPVQINADGRFMSLDGVLIDVKKSDITKIYTASNGTVYSLLNADVKVYENKVKTIKIEAENYNSVYSNTTLAWMKRYRPTLSGGIDMVLNSATVDTTKYVYANADTTINVNIIKTYYPLTSSNSSGVSNCYIEFKPVINSVPYKIYWSGYNDYASNINLATTLTINNGKTTETVNTRTTCRYSQKMLISFPDYPVVSRKSSDGTIINNFSNNYVLTSTRFTAGLQEEKQLYRSLVSEVTANIGFLLPRKNTAYTSEDDFFSFFSGNDQFGDKETIINPVYGKATILVANTTQLKGSTSGMIFIDYIKLVPVVDPNE